MFYVLCIIFYFLFFIIFIFYLFLELYGSAPSYVWVSSGSFKYTSIAVPS
jgi:hypothetical protein